MSVLRVHLFGSVRIAHDGLPAETNMSHTTQALLAYLLLQQNRSHPRQALAGMFWGDYNENNARSSLRTSLWRLRRVLEPDGIAQGTYLVTQPAGEVSFNWQSEYWLDVEAFEAQAGKVLAMPAATLEAAHVNEIESALQVYTADLLEGFYDDWVLRDRERLRLLYLRSLARLMQYYGHLKFYEQSLAYGQKILDMDPLREEIHREVIRLYLDNGQRALAAQQYETCRRMLADELGIAPLEETQALYAQIAPKSRHHQLCAATPRESSDAQQALQQLNQAMRNLDALRERLQIAIRMVKRSAESMEYEEDHN